jgi:hypothetical protein
MFELNADTKKLLSDIASLFGVKVEIVKDIWEYTIFTYLLTMLENPSKTNTIQIPFLGRAFLRVESTNEDDNSVTSFLSLNDEFKQVYKDIKEGKHTELADYIRRKYIDKVLDDTETF